MTQAPVTEPRVSLAASATRGAVVTLTGQLTRMVLQLIGIVVLARLLAPADYGLTAMVAVVVGFGELFRDFGLSSAAIQAKTLTRGQQTNLFWTNTGIGLTLTILVSALSGVVALAFGDPRLQHLTLLMSLTFLLNGLSTQYRADLARNLQFFRLTMSEIAGQLAGVVVGVVMAALGAGYWALAGQQITQGLATFVFLLGATRWFPGWIKRGESIREFVGYGSSLLGSQLLGYLVRNVDTVVVGRRFGPSDLGVYNRSFQLVMLPLLQIQAPSTRVALPVLSRLQDKRDRFAEFLNLGQIALLSVVGLLFSYLFAQAPSVIAVALGHRWEATVPIFRVMLLTGFFQAAAYAGYWVFLAKGLTRANFWYSLATRPAMAAIIVLGSLWGVYGVAVALAVATALSWPVSLIWIARVSDAPARAMFLNGVRTLVVFSSASAVCWLSTSALPASDHVLRLVVGLVALLGWLTLAALVWPQFRRDVVSIVGIRRHLRRDVRPGVEPDAEPGAEPGLRPETTP